ncbi:MAG: hypothetical protein M5U13_07505 [Thermoanaerobaculia bacterium]|nr:hypothetical protein [Thermoanaerobaculia bacterium]
MRALRPPLPLEVRVTPEGRPAELRPLESAETANRPRLEGRVRVASGPWQLEEGWWTDQPLAREYWDVELAGGALCRLHRDPTTGAWHADGIYD